MVVVKIGADDSEGGRVWQNHVQTHARAYPRKKTKVSENKAKRENENKTKRIKWRDIRSLKKHFNRLKCGLECWKEKKEMKKKNQRKTTWENFARVASGIIFASGFWWRSCHTFEDIVAKQDSVSLSLSLLMINNLLWINTAKSRAPL